MEEIITSDNYSIEEKDASIQSIIEDEEFVNRISKYYTKLAEMKKIIDPRGIEFSKQCISEIKNT